jgi:hypothetical protein
MIDPEARRRRLVATPRKLVQVSVLTIRIASHPAGGIA